MVADGGPFGCESSVRAATTVNDGGPRRMDLPPFLPPDRSCAPTTVNEPYASRWRRDQSPRDRRAESSRYRVPSPCVGGRPWISPRAARSERVPSQARPRPHRPRGLPRRGDASGRPVFPLFPQRGSRDVVRLSNGGATTASDTSGRAPVSGACGHTLVAEFPWRERPSAATTALSW